MSQAKLTLRPPPNVDFVQGYPGIPPGAERPQAAVKGAIEVRVNQQGVKAKWVRIELRKIEVLPGGGQAGTFFDYVGQSPVNLWTATEGDYGILRPQDFPFYIRIPESLPPTIALEKGAGIKYELIATVCIKGKRGFFRRSKSTVLSTASQIIIDKHELHSTWPIYSQPETRNITQDGITLTVDRNQTCYGPGDRVFLTATLKSDSLHTVILRGFEFQLKETTVFRAGPQTTGKKGTPQIKVSIVADQKVPTNATLYGGNQSKTDLSCTVPSYHTSATINAARHIDITYTLTVKALMGTGMPVVMDLPVIVSNWPRNVSIEAARRIGTTHSLSVVSQSTPNASPSNTYATRPSNGAIDKVTESFGSKSQFGMNGFSSGPGLKSDEMGYIGQRIGQPILNMMAGSRPSTSQHVSVVHSNSLAASDTSRARSDGGSSGGAQSRSIASPRLTVSNMSDDTESPLYHRTEQRSPPPAPQRWLSAEDEKRRLYEMAKAQVDRVQGVSSPHIQHSPQVSEHVDAGPVMHGFGVAAVPWSTAEAEKERLYDQAQAAAMRTQGFASYTSPPPAISGVQSPTMSAGAVLYQQAIPAVNQSHNHGPDLGSRMLIPQYPSGESEKTAYQIYYEAKAAAARNQGHYSTSEPISYDALYPVDNSGSSQPHPAPSISPPLVNGDSDLPPAFGTPSHPYSVLSEKERLRRHYENQDAAMMSAPTSPPLQPLSMSPQLLPMAAPPPSFTPSPVPPGFIPNGLSEKEILRRKLEADDAAQAAIASPTAPTPRSLSISSVGHSLPPIPRSPPAPPVFDSPPRQLTASEEKARLRAQYEAEDARAARGAAERPPSQHSNHSLPIPPPLRPRPPVQYIQETQEEDTRTQSQLLNLDKRHLPEDHTADFEFPARQLP